MAPEQGWADVGRRVAAARATEGLTQDEVAIRAQIERTALAKVERGTRGVSALELARLAETLRRPLEWFIEEAPPTVVSRRERESGSDERLDVELDLAARDVELLAGLGYLTPTWEHTRHRLRTHADAEALASQTRELLRLGAGPVVGLGQVCDHLGMHVFVADAGEGADDGAYVMVEGQGVCIVNGADRPGRRRFTLAHELGHHLLGDAFALEANAQGEALRRERMINSFAAHFLMPRAAVTERWNDLIGSMPHRQAAIHIAVEFRVSWKAVCGFLRRPFNLIGNDTYRELTDKVPSTVEILKLGLEVASELPPGYTSPSFNAAVVDAVQDRQISVTRGVAMLRGSVSQSELENSESGYRHEPAP